LPAGSMIFIWWKLKMSYHTAYPNWDSQAVVCHVFLFLTFWMVITGADSPLPFSLGAAKAGSLHLNK
jgi:hypothetical protein